MLSVDIFGVFLDILEVSVDPTLSADTFLVAAHILLMFADIGVCRHFRDIRRHFLCVYEHFSDVTR